MSGAAHIWFAMFAVVGVVSGLLAAGVLWMIVTRPLLVAQAVAGLR